MTDPSEKMKKALLRHLRQIEGMDLGDESLRSLVRDLRYRFVAAREVYAAQVKGRTYDVDRALVAAAGPTTSDVPSDEEVTRELALAKMEEIALRVYGSVAAFETAKAARAKARAEANLSLDERRARIFHRVHGMSVADYKRKRANEREREEQEYQEQQAAKRKKREKDQQPGVWYAHDTPPELNPHEPRLMMDERGQPKWI